MSVQTEFDPTGPLTTSAGTYTSIGTDPHGTPVFWRLSDAQGRPAHGLVTGWTGAGATVLLTHITTAATQAGLITWYLDAHTPTVPDASWHTGDVEVFVQALEEQMRTRLDDPRDAEPLLVVIDDPRALDAYGATVQVMATMGALVRIGFVVRAAEPTQQRLSRELRSITAHDQYLVFDHGAHTEPMRKLAAFLPGYTAPARGPVPGRTEACGKGRYGRDGACRQVTVTAP